MGAVCAVVYLLAIIVFIPFPFYKDIVAATSGGGNRDVMMEHDELETGRILHLFPHSKVTAPTKSHFEGHANSFSQNSWRLIYPPFCPYNPLFSWALATIYSIFGGAINFSYLHSPRFQCLWSTLLILA